MNGKAWQSQSRGRGRGRGRARPCNHHHPFTSPTTSPPVNVVREHEHSVNVNVNVNMNGNASVNVNVNVSRIWQQKSHLNEKKNDPTGMLNLQVANKLNISDDNDDSVSETRNRISKPTHHTETEPFDIKKDDLSKCMIPSSTGACSGNITMDSKAWQSQPCGRGWGRGRGHAGNHHPSISPTTSPPVNVVGDKHSVSVNGNRNVSNSGSVIKNGSETWPQKSNENEKKNDPTGMLHLHEVNKLNISDVDDVSLSETRTGEPTHQTETEPFDICPPKQCQGGLKPSLFAMNREKRKEMNKSSCSISGDVLRPGMVLLKSYISLRDQVKIVKKCRDLGIGVGGFFQPGYEDGAILHLKMMCLGKNWDPRASRYGQQRPYDGALPPQIPDEFHQFIHAAIRDSHSLVQQHSKTPNSNPHHLLPDISSDICIVNFYSESGRLGLHQDKDESEKSIRAGLPVVSFSIGDSAEFLYGDERDVDTAKKVLLESGDVLIFGGKSRNIFHGVTTIKPKTAPELLLQETNLRPGRLNLTFRQY